ncbi:MAG: hypothetical protein QXQ14_03190 [Candidatus Aenigmatarchaeota archaeon]
MYRVGRRFEYRVIYYLKKNGIKAKRIPLSGKRSEFYPNADILIEINDKKILGQLKYSRKKYVIFTKKELEQLKNNQIYFLCFSFFRQKPKFIIKSEEKNYVEKNSENLVISKDNIEKVIKINDLVLKILEAEEFINLLKQNIK